LCETVLASRVAGADLLSALNPGEPLQSLRHAGTARDNGPHPRRFLCEAVRGSGLGMLDLPRNIELEKPAGRVAVVSCTGEHDFAARDGARDLLSRLIRENGLVVTDFSRAEFVDSWILAVLRDTGRAARERGVTFRVQLGTAPIVAMIFEVSGVLDELECVSTREEALRDAAATSDPQG
jgi:anti-anti-sigma factor